MSRVVGRDEQPADQRVNRDYSLGLVLSDVALGLEEVQHHGHLPVAEQRDLPVPFDGGMRLGPQACSSLLQVEKLGRIAESILRVGAKPFGNGHTPDRSDVS